MQVFLCDDVTIETFIALPAQQRNSVLRPLPTPDLHNIYEKLVTFILHDSTNVAAKTRDILRELLGDNRTPLAEALTPALVVTSLDGSFGCHHWIFDSVSDVIFISRSLWEQWRDALRSQSQDVDGLQVVVVATLLHELAHRCISLAAAQFGFTAEQTRTHRELASKLTPDRLRVPWLPGSKGEAGQYTEWRIFGGILGWDRRSRKAYIRVGLNDHRVLTEPMVSRGARKLLLDYVEEFGLLDTVSPSPSTAATALTLEYESFTVNPGIDPSIITICNGISWNIGDAGLSEAEVEQLRDMADAEAVAEALKNDNERAQAKLNSSRVEDGVAGGSRFAMDPEPQMLSGDTDGDRVSLEKLVGEAVQGQTGMRDAGQAFDI
ncbi:hypothetical protein FB451DRAFT_1245982 [Mycena latifolia]|nr:hypothetical protein FB451DRAFT_1245982 [Mycena latifolia]